MHNQEDTRLLTINIEILLPIKMFFEKQFKPIYPSLSSKDFFIDCEESVKFSNLLILHKRRSSIEINNREQIVFVDINKEFLNKWTYYRLHPIMQFSLTNEMWKQVHRNASVVEQTIFMINSHARPLNKDELELFWKPIGTEIAYSSGGGEIEKHWNSKG